jgi:hypothetical protein
VEIKQVTEDDALFSKKCKLFYKKGDTYVEKGLGMLYLKSADNGKTQVRRRFPFACALNTGITAYQQFVAMLLIWNDFFGSGSYLSVDLGSGSGSCFRSCKKISNILDINFTFVFLPCKCVRLLIVTRYKFFRGIFC